MSDELIGAGIFLPLFSKKSSDRAMYREFYCSIERCPLRDRGECINASTFKSCPMGRVKTEQSKQKRAKAYAPWMTEHRQRVKNLEAEGKRCPSSPRDSLEFIGDLVWLPYSHITGCEEVPFKSRRNFGMSGLPFLDRDDFTIDVVVALVKYRPNALFGGEIKRYQAEEVPRFVRALRAKAPDLFVALVEREPSVSSMVETAKSITVPIKLIPHGVVDGYLVEKEYKPVKWDGEFLTVCGRINVLGLGLATYEPDNVTVRVKPRDDLMATVTDPDLVESLSIDHPEYL